MNDNPKISVIMSVYNAEKYLKKSIKSILDQTYQNFEFIIINDGSSDDSEKIIKSFSDKRIILISRPNKGLTKSLNEGIKISKGEYIARMDADDISMTDRFLKQINFFKNNSNISLCGTYAEAIDQNGNFIKNFDYPPLTHKNIKRYYLFHNPFIHSSVMMKKKVLTACGNYDENLPRAQDYELWGRIISRFQTANLPERLIKYRILDEGITKSKNLSMRLISLKIRLKYLKSILK